LSVQDLSALGLTGVNSNNLSAVLNAIASASLGNIDSLSDLQAIVNSALAAQAAALTTLVGYADSNTGTAPAESVYTTAGVIGLQGNASLLDAVNSALASTAVTGTLVDTTVEVQTIVDAYAAILAEANGSTADATASVDPTASVYQAVGVNLGAIATNTNGLSLLNDLVGERNPADVDSVSDLNTLADAVNRLLVVAAGGTASPAFTAALQLIMSTISCSADSSDSSEPCSTALSSRSPTKAPASALREWSSVGTDSTAMERGPNGLAAMPRRASSGSMSARISTSRALRSKMIGTSSRCDSRLPRSSRSMNSANIARSCSACWSTMTMPSASSVTRKPLSSWMYGNSAHRA
jgi:hypothetical protein